ncbi:hypothetical protein [Nodularia spumigena]|nr:hypothetical protein [Nodularia spumigena]MDB9321688.1 hypothetical protein [Nodularia spumigena CS-591/07A]MDB9331626.1 hypothetical protein [Nodularia spumigena CS-591/04]MDB9361419.1 hypothetical protein [Nodularia spumigena CS-588/02]MDB9365829.1 hypothetical protein [Nodularia spumigena CS-588/02A10]MDB9400115.1 hypothetical protein [Microcystis aeruginosa CS-567/02-A1]
MTNLELNIGNLKAKSVTCVAIAHLISYQKSATFCTSTKPRY